MRLILPIHRPAVRAALAMRTGLERLNAELEDRVKERTAQLEQELAALRSEVDELKAQFAAFR